jgi:hypothetical protein
VISAGALGVGWFERRVPILLEWIAESWRGSGGCKAGNWSAISAPIGVSLGNTPDPSVGDEAPATFAREHFPRLLRVDVAGTSASGRSSPGATAARGAGRIARAGAWRLARASPLAGVVVVLDAPGPEGSSSSRETQLAVNVRGRSDIFGRRKSDTAPSVTSRYVWSSFLLPFLRLGDEAEAESPWRECQRSA